MDIIISNPLDGETVQPRALTHLGHYYHQVLACMGYPLQAPPVADLLRQFHQLSGLWLLVSPISWEATQSNAHVVAIGSQLGLSAVQGKFWFELFAKHAADYFPEMIYHDAYTWLIRVDGCPEPNAEPLHRMSQLSLFPQLAILDKTGFWPRILTEAQMLFNQVQNEKNSDIPINGIWVWGRGLLAEPGTRPIFIDSERGQRLAQLLSTEVHEFSAHRDLPKTALLLLDHPATLKDLQPKIKHHAVNWYWDNASYHRPAAPWFKRIWGW